MASFLEDLWSSIFTPGTTPTLLKATNATFAALQAVLFALLIGTHSIHLVILSFLSGALWWSINWFATELQQVRAKEAAEKEKQEADAKEKEKRRRRRRTPGGLDSGESETETETESITGGGAGEDAPPSEPEVVVASGAGASNAGSDDPPSISSLSTSPLASDSELKKRRSAAESSGYISTDSEWEKVDEKER
ncbi:SMK killer toxin resistance protein [Arachnomyces sp. PD_36]|nr:SMK killer toxin resistance protein [Arachnomyces sp. PD_36]